MNIRNKTGFIDGKRIAVLLLTYGFLLLLSRGFVVSGDDWFFSSRTMDESLLEALAAGYRCAKEHYFSTNGRLIGNALSQFFGCSEFWREIVRCGIILTILIQICRLGQVRSFSVYCISLMLLIALPADIYRQCYAWAAGFFNYVPPIMLILSYFFLYEKESDRVGSSCRNPFLFLIVGLSTSFFVENISIGMLMLSAGVLLWERRCRGKWSAPLLAHLIGCFIGCIIMFAAPGYSNVNVEGYRTVSGSLGELVQTIQTNFASITMYITERNWTVIIPLTALSLILMLEEQPGSGVARYLHRGVILCLMISPVWFFANYNILRVMDYSGWVSKLRFLVDLVFNILYLTSVWSCCVMCLRDPVRKRRAVLCIAAIPLILMPLVVVSPIGPRCMYVPYMLMVCLILLFCSELGSRHRFPQGASLRIPVVLVTAAVLCCYLWIAVWNGHYEQIRIRETESAMEKQAAIAVIPEYPYMEFVHSPNGSAIRAYYYYRNPGDLAFQFIPNKDWYLKGS